MVKRYTVEQLEAKQAFEFAQRQYRLLATIGKIEPIHTARLAECKQRVIEVGLKLIPEITLTQTPEYFRVKLA